MKNIYQIAVLILLTGVIYSCKEKPTPPTLSTIIVSEISYTTATSGGEVKDEDGTPILARGICWNTSVDPTIDNSKTTEAGGLGTFSSNLTQLTENTLYYVRAYATNVAGTGYGNQVTFTTSQVEVPVLTTTAITSITQTTAASGGNITDDKGGSVIARGVCWGTETNPTLEDNKTIDGTGTGVYISSITDLIGNTTYYVRAYATNSVGTTYGNEISFKTNPILVTGITLGSVFTEIERETSKQLTAIISPINATNKNVIWSSSDNLIATVDNGLVSGVSIGSVTITATTQDGSFSANCQVNVIPLKVTGITLNASMANLLENETYQLIASVSPPNADNISVTWSSSNSNIATVNNSGFVTAISIGSVEIIATTIDGSFTAICSISVVPITDKIGLTFGGSYSIINGWMIGSMYSYITNNSSFAITLTKFEIIDSGTNTVKVRSTDVSQLGILNAGETKNLGSNINLFNPIFKWYFTYNGNSYTIQHQLFN